MHLIPIYAIIAVIGWGGSSPTIKGWGNEERAEITNNILWGNTIR
jgi:hypothetical protein